MGQLHAEGTRGGTFADNYVYLKILHGRVENLFDKSRKSVYLVDEEDVVLLKVCEQCDEVACLFDRGSRGYADVDIHFVGDYTRKGRFSESGRTVEQDMVEHVPSHTCRFYINFQIFLCLCLSDIFVQPLRTQCQLGFRIVFDELRAQHPVVKFEIFHVPSVITS